MPSAWSWSSAPPRRPAPGRSARPMRASASGASGTCFHAARHPRRDELPRGALPFRKGESSATARAVDDLAGRLARCPRQRRRSAGGASVEAVQHRLQAVHRVAVRQARGEAPRDAHGREERRAARHVLFSAAARAAHGSERSAPSARRATTARRIACSASSASSRVDGTPDGGRAGGPATSPATVCRALPAADAPARLEARAERWVELCLESVASAAQRNRP